MKGKLPTYLASSSLSTTTRPIKFFRGHGNKNLTCSKTVMGEGVHFCFNIIHGSSAIMTTYAVLIVLEYFRVTIIL
jgi:hypothetical protein